MKKKRFDRKLGRKLVVLTAAAMIGILLCNLFLMCRITSGQEEEIARMRVQNAAANFQKSLTRAENALERVGSELEVLLRDGAGETQVRQFLLRQKELEYELSKGLCLNVFCVVEGRVMISGMATPKDYVLQDRSWYRGLMAVKKGEVYLSPAYDDAFSDNMCYTVAKLLNDGSTLVGIDYSVSEIQELVENLSGDGYQEAMIVDSNEVIVGYSDPQLVGKKLSLALPQYRDVFLRAHALGEESVSLRSRQGGLTSVFCSKMENNWYLMCSVSGKELYQNSYRLILRSGIAALAIILAVCALLLVILRDRQGEKRPLFKRREKGDNGRRADMTVDDQLKFQRGITLIFVATLAAAIVICVRITVSESRIRMESELEEYKYAVGDWVLEQKSILDMFENVVVARPEILDDYEGMVKFLDDITKHYPKISATYIANPDFRHGHPMVMNNGWVPQEDYVEEDRVWYTGALTAGDFNITEPYYDARTGKYCITFSKVVQSEQGEFYGVFAIDFYLDVLTNILGQSYSKQGYAFLADKNGLIIDHPNSEYEFAENASVNIHDLVYDKLYREDGMVSFRDYDGKYKVGASTEETDSGFRIIVVKNWWSIYGNILEYMTLFLGTFGLCIFAVNAVMHRLIRWQQKANKELKEMALSAIQAEEAKSRFLSNMSHEIRTPINAVLGMNEMILRECGDTQILDYAENIRRAGRMLLFLINDILDMSKIEMGRMEIVPAEYELGELVLDLWNMICLRAQEKGLSIAFHLTPDLPGRLFGDDQRIKQVVTNLLTNAVKYTSQGSVEMDVSYRRESEKKLILIVSVKDTGMGIRKEDIGKLFEKFQRLDEKKNRRIEGTGLGLHITLSLLELMGGEITVESEYGKGSVFTVTIPQEIVSEEPVGEFEELHRRHRTGGKDGGKFFEAPGARVLVVDDNAMNLAVFQALLKRTKVTAVTADSGRECLELIRKEKYHIIFMDHMMPEMDGIETLHEMRRLTGHPNADTPVIALTANAVAGAKEMYQKEGFADFLAKPIEGEVMEKMIADYLPAELLTPFTESGEAEGGTEQKREADGDPREKEREERCLREGISLREGMNYAGGDRDVYLDLIRIFVRGRAQQEQKIKSLLSEGNMADYGVLTHALKGNARTLGAKRLSELALEHEKAGREGRAAYAKEHWEELTEEWERCCKALEAFYHEYRQEEPERYAAVTGGTGRIAKEELDTLIKLLDEFQTQQAAQILKAWLEKPLEPLLHGRLRDALIAIEEEFDEERAIECLKECMPDR